MTTYTWPTTAAMKPRSFSMGARHNVVRSRSPLNGGLQTAMLPGARWFVTVDMPDQSSTDRAALEALYNRLGGGDNRLALWDMRRAKPRGTIALSGVTASAASQFSTSLTLNGCGAGTTLLAGDRIGVPISTGWGQQLLEVSADSIANGSGVMVVPVHTQLRGSVTSGASVVLIKPTALFIPADANGIAWQQSPGGVCAGVAFDLIEAFS